MPTVKSQWRWIGAILGGLLCLHTTLAHGEKPPALLVPEGERIAGLESLSAMRMGHLEILAYSHDGKLLATSEEDGRVCIWNLADMQLARCFSRVAAERVTMLAFAPDGRWLTIGYADGSIGMRSPLRMLPNEQCHLAALPEELALGRAITSMIFPSPDTLLAIGSKGGTGRMWKSLLAAGSCRQEKGLAQSLLPAPKNLPSGLFEATALDAAGRYLAIATDAVLGVWDASSGEKLWLGDKHSETVLTMAMSPDGRRLAAGLLDGGLRLFEVQSGQAQQLDSPHRKAIRALAFSPDGRSLVAGSDDARISVWDLPVTSAPRILTRRAGITALAFRSDGAKLATASEDVGITFWDTSTYEEAQVLHGNADWIRSLDFNAQGTLLATTSDDRELRIFERSADPKKRPQWSLLQHCRFPDGIVRAAAFDWSDEPRLVVAGDSRIIRLFRVSDCSEDRERLREEPGWHKSLAFSADGSWLAIASDDGSVSIWDGDTKKKDRKRLLVGHGDAVRSVAFSPRDSTLLVTGSYDKTARLWNVASGALLHTFEAQKAGVKTVVISPDGDTLAIAADKEVALWSLADYSLIGRLPHADEVSAARFTADGVQLATAERKGRLRLWDLQSQREVARTEPLTKGEPESVLALAFSPADGSLAAAGLGRIWFRQLQTLPRVQMILLQGSQGWANWIAQQDGGTLYRSDTGGLLWQQGPGGELGPLVPTKPRYDPQLELKMAIEPSSPWAPGTIVATVENMPNSGPALWLRWELRGKPEEPDLQDRFSFQLPSIEMRLESAAKTQVRIPITRRSSWPPLRKVHLCLTVIPKYGEPQTVCQEVGIGPWWWQHGPMLLLVLLLFGCFCGLGRSWLLHRSPLAHPLVKATRGGKNPLADRTLHEYPEVEQVLRRAEESLWTRGLRGRALNAAGLDPLRWQRALVAMESVESCAIQLAESLLAQLAGAPTVIYRSDELTAFRILLPALPIYVSEDTVLIICTTTAVSPQAALARCSPQVLGHPRFTLLVDLTPAQQSPAEIRQALIKTHGGTLFVVLSELLLRRILLAASAPQAQNLLRVAIVEQCAVEQISPYQEGNGIEDERKSFFFGRESELGRLLSRHRQNWLLVGPRQMGKSSLLNALRRELSRRYPDIKVLKYQFASGSLRVIGKVDAELRADTPEDFYRSVMERTPKHQVFLLDEVDEFVQQEQRTQYGFCNVMRALSGQGRASFVLAGHQALHDVVRTADHPLRNFGELLRLEPLDHASAQRMIMEPLTGMELHFAEVAATVDWLRWQTSCRPYLLSQACSAIVHLRKPPSAQPITLEEVQAAVVENNGLRDTFGNWEASSGPHAIDCAVMRAALLLERATLSQLDQFLRAHGAELSLAELDRSVSRLYVMHYALVADSDGVLSCPLPLFRYFLSQPRSGSPRGQKWDSATECLRNELLQSIAALNRSRFP